MIDSDLQSYVESGFRTVNGMTSGIAMKVMADVLSHQNASGITGPLVEIGSFEGRTFVLLAKLACGSLVATIDSFRHPDANQIERFRSTLDLFQVDRQTVVEMKATSLNISPPMLMEKIKTKARFFHIDGGHRYADVMHDLILANACLKEDGVLCLDDVLHPYYIGLTLAVHDFLRATPALKVFAMVDRESIVAASKYLVCHEKHFERYRSLVETTYASQIRSTRADLMAYTCPIIVHDNTD